MSKFWFGVLLMCAGLTGCSSVTVMETKPTDGSRLAEVYFSSVSTDRVLVSSLIEQSYTGGYSGLAMPGRVLPEPMWVSPGWLKVTYACSRSPELHFVATVGISQRDRYYLYCDDHSVAKAALLRTL